MNPPDPSGPDGRLPRLAGYADDELDSMHMADPAAGRLRDW